MTGGSSANGSRASWDGGGVAFRTLRPAQPVRYRAVDLDEDMLERARRRAGQLGLGQVEFVKADMRRLPLEDESVDLCPTYRGLHMIPDSDAALAEMGRCLRSDAAIVGTAFLAGGSRRKQMLFAIGGRTDTPSLIEPRTSSSDA